MPKRIAAFVDESFDRFFDLSDNAGYFCMGILLVPEDYLWEFEQVFVGYRKALAESLGVENTSEIGDELKSTKLRRLDSSRRRELLSFFIDWAKTREISVGGFFTSTEGYIHYNTRNERAGDLYYNSQFLDDESVRRSREDISKRRASSPAESLMIGDIAQAIAGMLLHYCGERDMSFTLHYDPRSDKEDIAVFKRIDELLPPIEEIVIGRKKVYLGCSNQMTSKSSSGLQMVDFITRDLRSLFLSFPELLSSEATTELITPSVGDPSRTIATTIGGRIFKWGEESDFPAALASSIFEMGAPFTIADYLSILMTGRLSCYSSTGEARIVNLSERSFESMVD